MIWTKVGCKEIKFAEKTPAFFMLAANANILGGCSILILSSVNNVRILWSSTNSQNFPLFSTFPKNELAYSLGRCEWKLCCFCAAMLAQLESHYHGYLVSLGSICVQDVHLLFFLKCLAQLHRLQSNMSPKLNGNTQ